MIEFTEGGKRYRGYTGGHCFCDGLEITPAEFYKMLCARHPRR